MRSINKSKISIVIPCYNEEKNVSLLYNEFVKSLSKKDYYVELIYVNDGSKDNTISELKKLLKYEEFDIRIIDFSRNFGKEAAIYAGLKNSTGDYVGIIDADLQHRPEYIDKMYNAIKGDSSYDAACCFQDKRNEGKIISFLKKVFYKLISKMSEIDFKSGASDFRLFKRYVVDAILALPENNRFSKGIFSWIGFNTYFIPYTPDKRINGKSNFGFKSSVKYALSGILSFSVAPLRIATYLGLMVSVISFFSLVGVIIKKLFIGIEVPGYATLLVCLLMMGGLILLCLGIVGEYLARAYVEIKNRPIYIEKENLSNIDDLPL